MGHRRRSDDHRSDRIVVRIDSSTICGTDLHILKGDVPETTPGTVLGHEAVGTVLEVGANVRRWTRGPGADVVRQLVRPLSLLQGGQLRPVLGGGGWIFGHLIDGLQAEYARVPFADNSVYKVPEGLSDEQVLFLADILPTAYEVGVLNGTVSPGDAVAIVGAGPIGLAAILTASSTRPAGSWRSTCRQPARQRAALRRGYDDQQLREERSRR